MWVRLLSHQFWRLPGAKSYDQAKGAGGALGWRLSADEVTALEKIADTIPPAVGAPFENW